MRPERRKMKIDTKKMVLFVAIAYGITYLMGIFMFIGVGREIDLSCFANAQMMYPAAGVILGKLIFDAKDIKLPKAFYVAFLVTTLAMMAISFVSFAAPLEPINLMGMMTIDVYNLASQYILMAGGIVMYITQWACGKQKRFNAGLTRRNIKLSVAMVALYLALYIGRFVVALLMDGIAMGDTFGSLAEWVKSLGNVTTLSTLLMLPFSFVMVFPAFLGEEYGWRYFLQPAMMKKFGPRGGVLLLGVVWGLWHLPMDFCFYTTETGLQMQVNQIVTCVCLGIFFAYAYLKTQNFWVPVIIHYLNNNLIPVLAGNYSADVIQNQHIEWVQLPINLILSLGFAAFIFSKEFSKKRIAEKEEKLVVEAKAFEAPQAAAANE